MRVVDSINAALNRFLGGNPKGFFIGEDVLDPYGGAFKVARGLSNKYPKQVITTPISEAGIVGVATGLAIKGYPVCVEIMFGDFLTLAADQIINHMAKLPWVYSNKISVPVVVRTPMGGRRGYGATHSQSLEKHFCGIPGLTVVAISQYADIEKIYSDAFNSAIPHLIIENKAIYPKEIEANPYASVSDAEIVMISYGGCVEDCVKAARHLHDQEEVVVKVVEINTLSPLNHMAVKNAVGESRNVLVVEEGSKGWGFAAEIAHALVSYQSIKFASISAPDHPIPSSKAWETRVLPSVDTVITSAMEMIK
jgi:pyruvate/2-oxoglutarate/acetoin dehydrogenase E1 component